MAGRRPESPYQMGFDFTATSEQIVRAIPTSNFDTRDPELARFIRSVDDGAIIQTPSFAADFLMREVFFPFEDFTQEELITLMLNTKNQVTHTALIYRGTINAVHVRTAEIFRPAILVNARSIMLAHNHPSGDSSPSPEDVNFTGLCTEAGRLLDIPLLDHIIVGRNRWASLKERGLGF